MELCVIMWLIMPNHRYVIAAYNVQFGIYVLEIEERTDDYRFCMCA